MTRSLSTLFASAALALASGIATNAVAADYGTVVSSTPVYAQVSVPQRQCVEQEQRVRPAQSGAGGLIGALVGGLAGNAIGHGGGRALATGAGVIGGALLGDHVEANASAPTSTLVQHCQTVSQYQNQLVGYDVVYSFNGRNYSTRLASDPGLPGASLPLNVSVSPAAMAPAVQTAPVTTYVAPQVIYTQPPVVVAPPVYGPPVGLSIGAEWGGGYRHWR
ncbi:glycine zipper 2TM domain-containing protein [Pseudorhodoferax sp. Leaf267]|uniref:glycine zipper 2TM domain-containing protein n=1 Tax=Pseudorhodoferax sp. Leaf267 TaxID=1736316 RepID=UPI0006FAC434|nr:glycine zipper 2TM domain-containing protein [Pseudorhodoferax sp. Leaf267]KQP22468.1 hypothetical protein ASF43_00610 [Pseudorhodoferax sp. Leaf267]